jgi:uncharacterized protein YndB with AHSA1/START domain
MPPEWSKPSVEEPMSRSQYRSKTVYVIYIAAPPERVWQGLTSPDFTRQYFFGLSAESDWAVGSDFILRKEDGQVHVQGKVLECAPPWKLSVSWRVESIEEFKRLPECIVTYEIVDVGDAVRLTMTEGHLIELDEKIVEGGRQGWPVILSSLKSLIETGRPIIVKMEPPKEMLEAVKRMK